MSILSFFHIFLEYLIIIGGRKNEERGNLQLLKGERKFQHTFVFTKRAMGVIKISWKLFRLDSGIPHLPV